MLNVCLLLRLNTHIDDEIMCALIWWRECCGDSFTWAISCFSRKLIKSESQRWVTHLGIKSLEIYKNYMSIIGFLVCIQEQWLKIALVKNVRHVWSTLQTCWHWIHEVKSITGQSNTIFIYRMLNKRENVQHAMMIRYIIYMNAKLVFTILQYYTAYLYGMRLFLI